MATENAEPLADPAADLLASAIISTDIPKYYFNGFTNGIGNSDIVIALQLNNKPIAVLNVSYTIAKTLSKKLNDIIAELEKASKHEIMTTDDVTKYLNPKP